MTLNEFQKQNKMANFEETIKAYLDLRAANDEQFALSYKKEKKSIAECCRYIQGEVSKVAQRGCAFMDDTEVFSLAVHYYDEDDIKITPINGSVRIANNGATYEPTEADKENAKRDALRRLEEEAYQKLHAPKKKKVTEEQPTVVQASLFDQL